MASENEKTSFTDLGLSDPILKAISECGYDTPTPIQAKAIPQILMARDLIGIAQTGTGKTAGFTLPMIEILAGGRAKARMPRSLILSPTRELAAQIAENFDTYGKHCKLNKALLVGGVSMDEQIKILERGADVLIATPGRLLDLFERGNILLTDIKVFVIDEADRMMDMGFIPDIEKIASLLPPMRQTLLFSATMPKEIRKLAQKFLSNPKEVSVDPPARTAGSVNQYLIETPKTKKREHLHQILEQEHPGQAFIFCNRKRDIDGLVRWLKDKGYNAAAMHGDMVQSKRIETLESFRSGETTILVCSDVAARGIDIDNVPYVFNYDVPMNADDYVHRIGRTGRAGNKGQAWMLASKEDAKFLEAIEKHTKQKIEVVTTGSSKTASSTSGGQNKHKDKNKDNQPSENKSTNNKNNKKTQKSSQASRSKDPSENVVKFHDSDDENGNAKGQRGRRNENANSRRNAESDHSNVKGFGDEVPDFFSAG